MNAVFGIPTVVDLTVNSQSVCMLKGYTITTEGLISKGNIFPESALHKLRLKYKIYRIVRASKKKESGHWFLSHTRLWDRNTT